MLKNSGQPQEKIKNVLEIKNVLVEGGVFHMDWNSSGLTPATTPNASANTTPINSPQKSDKHDLTYKSQSNSIPIIGKNPKKLTFSHDDLTSPPSGQAIGFLDHLIEEVKNIIDDSGQPAKTNKISP